MQSEKKLSSHCLACGSSEASRIATRNDGEIFLSCQSCGSIYLEKIPTRVSDYYTADYFALGSGQDVINRDDHIGHGSSYEDTSLDADFYWSFRLVDYIANILQPETSSAKKCLDIGAATGRLLSLFNTAGYKTYGIELSEAALEIAAARGHIMSNQEFEEYSTQFTEFKVVTALEVIEHLEDLPEFFSGVYRVLADNGVFFGFFPSGDKRFFGHTDSYHWLHNSFEHLIYPSDDGIRRAMRSNFGDEIFIATFLTTQGEDVIPNTLLVGLKKPPPFKVRQKIKTLFEELNSQSNLNSNLSSPDFFERESQWIQKIRNQTRDNFVDLPFVVSLVGAKFGKNNSAEILLQEEFDPALLSDEQLLDLLVMAMHLGALAYIRSLLKSISLRPLISEIKKELRILVANFFYELKSDELSNVELLTLKHHELLSEYRIVSSLNDTYSTELQQTQVELQRSKEELKGSKEELKGSKEELKGSKEELKGSQIDLEKLYFELRCNQAELEKLRKLCFEYELENSRLGNRALKKLHHILNRNFPFSEKCISKILKYSLLSKRLLVDLALQIKCFLKQENIVENKIWPVKRPLVSVIIPCFNYGKFLSETIESVLNQTFSDFEIVVVDDGSTDSYTREILSTLNKPKTRLISQKNQGISMARNNGIRNAEGKYICCLDADDLLTPTYLEKCVYLLETRQIDICYSWVQLFGADNLLWRTGPFRIDELLKGNTVSTAAVFSRKAWKRAKGYSKKMRKGYEDWEFWIRMARLGVGGSVILEPLFLYRKHGVSMTSSTDKIHDQLCKQIRYLHRDICDNEFKIKKILELQLKAESNKHNSYFNILRKL